MTKAEKEIILNKDCISINQDPTEPGRKTRIKVNVGIWTKHLKSGSLAVSILNRHKDLSKKLTFSMEELGIGKKSKIKDVYAKK